eukprot:8660599-Pyramimonas_sp.AAC.1
MDPLQQQASPRQEGSPRQAQNGTGLPIHRIPVQHDDGVVGSTRSVIPSCQRRRHRGPPPAPATG